jgi:hypothetical protein
VGFGVLLPLLRATLANGLLQVENAVIEIEVRPPNGAELPAAVACDHRQPDQGTPVRIFERLIDDARGLLG